MWKTSGNNIIDCCYISFILEKIYCMERDVTLWQANAITQARYDLSSTQKDILYMAMSQLSKNDTAETSYYVSVKDLQRLTRSNKNYVQIKESVDDLVTKKIVIDKGGGNTLVTTFFSSAEYTKRHGMVELRMDSKIRPYFFDLKSHFTTFQLNASLLLKGKYSKRIYEWLSQYKNKQSITIDILDLKEKLEIINPKTGKDAYTRWAQFDARVMKRAQKELKELTDLEFTYKPRKHKGVYTYLDIKITYREIQGEIQFDSETESSVFQKLVQKFKLRQDQAIEVIRRYEIKDIQKKCYDITLDMSDNKVTNVGGYTAKMFDVVYKDKSAA